MVPDGHDVCVILVKTRMLAENQITDRFRDHAADFDNLYPYKCSERIMRAAI